MRKARSQPEEDLIRIEDERSEPVPVVSGRTYPPGDRIRMEAQSYCATRPTTGFVSGVAAGSCLNKTTGARDLCFALSIVDFLLEPAPGEDPVPPGQYDFGNLVHGRLPKRYVEGPQICTQA